MGQEGSHVDSLGQAHVGLTLSALCARSQKHAYNTTDSHNGPSLSDIQTSKLMIDPLQVLLASGLTSPYQKQIAFSPLQGFIVRNLNSEEMCIISLLCALGPPKARNILSSSIEAIVWL